MSDWILDMTAERRPSRAGWEGAEVSTTQIALSEDHPMKRAWNQWCETDEFKNALRWAVETKYDDGRPIDDIQREQHAKGAMWLAFTKGMELERKP